jgi:hypothetical protein
MVIEKRSKYTRDVKKMTKAHKLTTEEIDFTEELIIKDLYHKTLRFHKIICKKDKDRYSITIPNTQYRILITKLEDTIYLNTLLDHKAYDRINKNC